LKQIKAPRTARDDPTRATVPIALSGTTLMGTFTFGKNISPTKVSHNHPCVCHVRAEGIVASWSIEVNLPNCISTWTYPAKCQVDDSKIRTTRMIWVKSIEGIVECHNSQWMFNDSTLSERLLPSKSCIP